MRIAATALLLAALVGAPASATDIARCHASQVGALAKLGRNSLRCWSRHVKALARGGDAAALEACLARQQEKAASRYAAASRDLEKLGFRCALPHEGDAFLAAVDDFVGKARDAALEGADLANDADNRVRARSLKHAGTLVRSSLKARGRDARAPSETTLAARRTRAQERFRRKAAALGAVGVEALIAEVERLEAPLTDVTWLHFSGVSVWSGCTDASFDGAHAIEGNTFLEPDGSGGFRGNYEAWSGSTQEIGRVGEATGPLSGASFTIQYQDYYRGAGLFALGEGQCAIAADGAAENTYQVSCTAEDVPIPILMTCAGKSHDAVLYR